MWFLGSEEPPSGFGVGGSAPEVGAWAVEDLVASGGEGGEDRGAAVEGAGEIVAGAAGVGVGAEEAMDFAALVVGPKVAAAPRVEVAASAAQEGVW